MTFPLARVAAGAALLLPLISGCGSSSMPPSPVLNPSALNGNWLITGDMPQIFIPPPPIRTLGISATLDVVNGQVYAQVTYFYPCSAGASGGGTALAPASIAPDGSFTLSSLAGLFTPTVVLTIHGNVPTASSPTWSGTYSATNSNSGCTPFSGNFTATAIQPVTGVFSGNTTFIPPGGAASVPATLQMTLQQGGPSSLDPSLLGTLDSVNALSGTISLQGTPCATTGTLSIPSGAVFGSDVAGMFVMSDGSHLTFHGSLADPSSSTIDLALLSITGGPCDRWFGSLNTNLLKL
jgi:hypothetical protein